MQKWVVFAIPIEENRTKRAIDMETSFFTSEIYRIILSMLSIKNKSTLTHLT